MKSIVLVGLVLAVHAAAVQAAVSIRVNPSGHDYDALFATFKAKYGKSYETSLAEAKARKAYEANLQWAAELSAKNPLAKFGDTEYMDVPRSEFKKTHHNADFTAMLKKRKPLAFDVSASGSQIDWRTHGAVTAVKNQKFCGGGGWAFAATGNIEGQWAIGGNTLTALSEQELLSCVSGNAGCLRGAVDTAFEWLLGVRQGQIDTESSYPFVSDYGNQPLCVLPDRVVGATIGNWENLPENETVIEAYVYANGPVAVGLDATSLHTYTSGILTNCQFAHINHAALIVGFDDTGSTPYWIVKNSWGTGWGESGYFRLAKGSNQCGVDKLASSARLSSSGPTPPSPPITSVPTSPPAPTLTPVPMPPLPPTPPSSSSSSAGPEPPSPPPSPPSPPSSSSSSAGPPPSSSNFTFYLCQDDLCSDCQSYSLPQDTCIAETFNGDSFKAKCVSSGYDLDVGNYDGVTDCSVEGQWQRVKAGTCYLNIDGVTYVKYYCPY